MDGKLYVTEVKEKKMFCIVKANDKWQWHKKKCFYLSCIGMESSFPTKIMGMMGPLFHFF